MARERRDMFHLLRAADHSAVNDEKIGHFSEKISKFWKKSGIYDIL